MEATPAADPLSRSGLWTLPFPSIIMSQYKQAVDTLAPCKRGWDNPDKSWEAHNPRLDIHTILPRRLGDSRLSCKTSCWEFVLYREAGRKAAVMPGPGTVRNFMRDIVGKQRQTGALEKASRNVGCIYHSHDLYTKS